MTDLSSKDLAELLRDISETLGDLAETELLYTDELCRLSQGLASLSARVESDITQGNAS